MVSTFRSRRSPGLRRFESAVSATLAYWRSRWQERFDRPYQFDALRDTESLIDIAHTQAAGRPDIARRVVDEMFDVAGGALYGATIERRYLSLLAWYAQGRPSTLRAVRSEDLAAYREMVRENVLGEARAEALRRSRKAGAA